MFLRYCELFGGVTCPSCHAFAHPRLEALDPGFIDFLFAFLVRFHGHDNGLSGFEFGFEGHMGDLQLAMFLHHFYCCGL